MSSTTTQPDGDVATASTGVLQTLTAGALDRLAAARYLIAYPVAVLAWTLVVCGLAAAPVGVGIPVFLGGVWLAAALAERHLRWAAEVVGHPIEGAAPGPSAVRGLRRFVVALADRRTWTELMWLTVRMTVGLVPPLLSVALLAGAAWYVVYPAVWSLAPDGVLDAGYGVWTSDTAGESFHTWGLSVVATLLWWALTPALQRLSAGIDESMLAGGKDQQIIDLQSRVSSLATSRTSALDDGVGEMRRIERDIHDGAQARMVASGMHLGAAIDTFDEDPEAARRMLVDAHDSISDAIRDLRAVVRGIVPPVLADRGLVGAIDALALVMPLDVVVESELGGDRPLPRTIETAVYFVAAELLTNVAKHAEATRVTVSLTRSPGLVVLQVTDDGRGGAMRRSESGLSELDRRLAILEGTMRITSPVGGPTVVVVEVPCE